MARYPGAAWHRCPGSEPAIRPTQLIYHTAVMRDLVGLRNYFCSGRSGGIESHFGVGGRWGDSLAQDGAVEQWRDSEEQADANRSANRRPDGTGAISVETCDNAPQRPADIEPWTPKQLAALVRLGIWAHERHGIPLRICRSPDDPGYGWHAMWDNTGFELADGSTPWTPSAGKVCPGPARIHQLKTIVFPAIFAGRQLQEDDMSAEAEAQIKSIYDGMVVPGTSNVAQAFELLFNRVKAIEQGMVVPGTTSVAEAFELLFSRVRTIEDAVTTPPEPLLPIEGEPIKVTVDPQAAAAIAQDLAANADFIRALATANADEFARRQAE
jgi:hypothetical protein